MTEKDLVNTIKKNLIEIAEKKPNWTLFLGREELTARDLLKRLDKDRKLRKEVVESTIALAIKMVAQEGNNRVESNFD